MKIKENAKNTLTKMVEFVAVKTAVKSANTACVVWQYQPSETDKIKKMRKF